MTIRSSRDPNEFRGQELPLHSTVYGLRNFGVDSLFRLTGVMYKSAVWIPGMNIARCYKSVIGGMGSQTQGLVIDHSMENCLHGFYAYYDGSRDYHDKGDVTGIIKGWGEGVVGTKGFRVTYAQIMGLKFSGSLTSYSRKRIMRLYGDGVTFHDNVEDLLKAYPLTAGDLEYVPEADDDFWTRNA